jgi:hypothetical protein
MDEVVELFDCGIRAEWVHSIKPMERRNIRPQGDVRTASRECVGSRCKRPRSIPTIPGTALQGCPFHAGVQDFVP